MHLASHTKESGHSPKGNREPSKAVLGAKCDQTCVSAPERGLWLGGGGRIRLLRSFRRRTMVAR